MSANCASLPPPWQQQRAKILALLLSVSTSHPKGRTVSFNPQNRLCAPITAHTHTHTHTPTIDLTDDTAKRRRKKRKRTAIPSRSNNVPRNPDRAMPFISPMWRRDTLLQVHTTCPPILAKKEQEEEKKAMMSPFATSTSTESHNNKEC